MTTKEVGDAPCTWPQCSQPAAGGAFCFTLAGEVHRRGLCWEHLAFVIGVLKKWPVEFEALMSEVMGGKWVQATIKEGSDANTQSG